MDMECVVSKAVVLLPSNAAFQKKWKDLEFTKAVPSVAESVVLGLGTLVRGILEAEFLPIKDLASRHLAS